MKLIFSQTSIFHLYRLGVTASSLTENKYRLSSDDEIKSLILYCNRSDNTQICRQYDAFICSLEPRVLTAIEALTGSSLQDPSLKLAG